ncbi:MAG: MBL fold metallo-hydrolase [Clostridia bacterium]|nr:MBL fold metallo-hydrolase [Clostridia bacterium]
MKIRWYGHACFKLDFANGPYVVTDPFDDHVGYPLCDASADIVTTSHGHGDHNYVESIQGRPTVLNRTGLFTFDDLVVRGVKAYHDELNGAKRGDNIIYIFESDDLKIAHMGDLGHEPDLKQYAALDGVDVLMIPIGGYYTIDTETAVKIIEKIQPKLVIPMHFNTAVMNFPITDEKHFVELTGAEYWNSNVIEVTKENLSTLPKAVVMRYAEE